jgi:mannose/fructose/N-acetylgalactosamine-specific phosphotransferase system component IIC
MAQREQPLIHGRSKIVLGLSEPVDPIGEIAWSLLHGGIYSMVFLGLMIVAGGPRPDRLQRHSMIQQIARLPPAMTTGTGSYSAELGTD